MSLRPAATRRNLLALATVVTLLAAVLLSAAAWIGIGTEQHAWGGGKPPATVHVTSGRTYRISVPGGITNTRLLPAATAVSCTYRTPGPGVDQSLTVAAEYPSTKATDVVASFVAPLTGRITVSCEGYGTVYVDDADDTSFDWGTLALTACSAAWLAFVGCALALLWGLYRDRSSEACEARDGLARTGPGW